MSYIPSSEEEAKFLAAYDPSAFPGYGLTSDIAAFTIRNGQLSILLIQRGGFPYKGHWALPGGFVNPSEDALAAASRELEEETGVIIEGIHLEQLKTYTTPGRDPRMSVVSVAFFAVLPDLPAPTSGDDASAARWFSVSDLDLDGSNPDGVALAFDHAEIITDALERVRAKFEYSPLAVKFLDEEFTLPDLRRVYEAVWGTELHAANFRRKVLSTPGFVSPIDSSGPSALGGRNAPLYRYNGAALLHPAILRASK